MITNFMKQEERGFFLVETVVLGVFLLVLIGSLQFYHTAYKSRQANAAQTVAVFLAQEQIAYLTAKAKEGENTAITDIIKQTEQGKFTVKASLMPATDNLVSAEATVIWQTFGREQSLTLKRQIYRETSS